MQPPLDSSRGPTHEPLSSGKVAGIVVPLALERIILQPEPSAWQSPGPNLDLRTLNPRGPPALSTSASPTPTEYALNLNGHRQKSLHTPPSPAQSKQNKSRTWKPSRGSEPFSDLLAALSRDRPFRLPPRAASLESRAYGELCIYAYIYIYYMYIIYIYMYVTYV